MLFAFLKSMICICDMYRRKKIIVQIDASRWDICLLFHQVQLNKNTVQPEILRQWIKKEQCRLKETMTFKYRLFQPRDSLHFLTTCPKPESKCKKQRQNHRSLSLLCFVFFQMERIAIQENSLNPAARVVLQIPVRDLMGLFFFFFC